MTMYKCWIPGCLDREVALHVAPDAATAAQLHALTVPLASWNLQGGDAAAPAVDYRLPVAVYQHGWDAPRITEVRLDGRMVGNTWNPRNAASILLLRGERDKWQDDAEDDAEDDGEYDEAVDHGEVQQ